MEEESIQSPRLNIHDVCDKMQAYVIEEKHE